MTHDKITQQIVWYEGCGFLAIIVLTWMNEILDLPRYLKGYPTPVNWRESCIETLLIAVVWFAVHVATKRLLSQLQYLESFLMICAWCRRIKHDDAWLSLETYLSQGLDVTASHGICPDCRTRLMDKKGPPP